MIRNMTTGKVPKIILSFAIPLLIAELLQEMHYTVDSWVAGNFLGAESNLAIAAIGSTWHILMLLLSFLMGFSVGGTIVIARLVGAGKQHRLSETASTLIIFTLVSAPLLGIFFSFFAENMLTWLQVPAEVLPLATSYLRVMLVGLVFLVGHTQVNSIFRGLGNSKIPLYMVALSLLLNFGFNMLVIKFDGALLGLAVATVASQGVTFFISIGILVFRDKMLSNNILKWKFNVNICRATIKLAFPIGFEMMLAAGSILAISWFINHSGATVIAAVSIAQVFEEMVIVAGMSIASAVSVFVGQNVAAGERLRARKGTRVGLVMVSCFALLATGLALLLHRNVGLMFTTDSGILTEMQQYLAIIAAFYIVHAVTLVLGGALQGLGKPRIPLFASLISLWLVRVPLTWLLYNEVGAVGIWWAQVVAWVICLLFMFIYTRVEIHKTHHKVATAVTTERVVLDKMKGVSVQLKERVEEVLNNIPVAVRVG